MSRTRLFKADYIILFLLLVILAVAIVVPIVHPFDLKATDLLNRLQAPTFSFGESEYFLGTDNLGRDFLLRLIYATRTSLIVAFGALIIASTLGILLGTLSGMYGGWVDAIISFLIDAKLSLPTTIFAIALASILGSSEINMIIIIGLSGFASFARLVRSEIMKLKNANFIRASRLMGASSWRIAWEHFLPNILSIIIVNGTLRFASFVMLESSLSFLGLGIQPPNVSLGVMVSNGRDYLFQQWWLSIVPSLIIALIVLASSILGDRLRDRLDPNLGDLNA